MPHAPGDPSARARIVSDLWDGSHFEIGAPGSSSSRSSSSHAVSQGHEIATDNYESDSLKDRFRKNSSTGPKLVIGLASGAGQGAIAVGQPSAANSHSVGGSKAVCEMKRYRMLNDCPEPGEDSAHARCQAAAPRRSCGRPMLRLRTEFRRSAAARWPLRSYHRSGYFRRHA